MVTTIRDKHLESQLEQIGKARGHKTRSKTLVDIAKERIIQLEERGELSRQQSEPVAAS